MGGSQTVRAGIAGPGMRISTSELVRRTIDSGMLKSGMPGEDAQ